MHSIPKSLDVLIKEFSRLPGIGYKTAQRLAFFILNSKYDLALNLSNSLKTLKERIKHCTRCHGITEIDPCIICSDIKRNDSLICVVENEYDIFIFEKTNAFNGKYHVLGGVLSPLDGIGPEEINVKSLLDRLKAGMEIILATNSSVEGETTALYLSKILNEKDVSVSRLARGIPIGGDLEYLDDATLIRAMEGRTSI